MAGLLSIRTDANELLEQFCVTPFSYVLRYSVDTVDRHEEPQWGLLPSCENGKDKELQLSSRHAISTEPEPLDLLTVILWNLSDATSRLQAEQILDRGMVSHVRTPLANKKIAAIEIVRATKTNAELLQILCG